MKAKLGLIVLAVVAFGFLGSCAIVDAGLIGTWKADTQDLTIQFKADGTFVASGNSLVAAALVLSQTLGTTHHFTSQSGTGTWWGENLFTGKGTVYNFTYSIAGSTLTSNIFYEDTNITHTFTKQ